MNDYDFGNFLCMLREQKGMTQAEIAQMLNVTPAAVSKWENGESKPRTDTLFQLAEILGVTAQELIAGKYTEKENADRENELQEKINIMENVNIFLNFNVRIKRIFAYVIDYCVMGLFFLLNMIAGMKLLLSDNMVFSFVTALIMVFFAFLMIISFFLRDYICKGRSLGKRLMGLVVIDKTTGEPAIKRQLAIRNLIYFISIAQLIDGILMLTKGVSLCDNIAQTFVVSEKEWINYKKDPSEENLALSNSYSKKGIVIVAVSVIMLCVCFMAFSHSFLANTFNVTTSNTVQYNVAHNYIVTSGMLQEFSATKEDIKLTGVSIKDRSDDNTEGTAIISFKIKRKRIDVILHIDRGRWVVCEECTDAGELVCEVYNAN